MKRQIALVALTVAGVACGLDVGPLSAPRLLLTPVLDSIFVGDQLLHPQVTFFDTHGNQVNPGAVSWSSSDASVITVDPNSGKITAVAPGIAAELASAQGAEGFAIIAVSPLLKTTILIDSLVMLPGDTFTIPVQVKHEAPGSPVVWYSAAANAVFDLDSATGVVTAKATGGPLRVVVHAALSPDTAADSGTVEVVMPTDTSVGTAYYSIFGTAQRARRVSGQGLTYNRSGGAATFQLHLPTQQGSTIQESVDIYLLTPPVAPGTFAVDSISLDEAFGTNNPACQPPRNWGSWFTVAGLSRLDAVSRVGGSVTISQIIPVTGGFAMSGRFYLPVGRSDLYEDPTGNLPIRGAFVVPVVPSTRTC